MFYWICFISLFGFYIASIQSIGVNIVSENNLEKKFIKNGNDEGDFEITLITNGSYYMSINNKTWLSSSSTFIRANNYLYDNLLRTLVLNETQASSGYDILGRWQSIEYNYRLFDDVNTRMKCSIKTYDNYNLVRFTQNFPTGTTGSSDPNTYDSVISAFPSFKVQNIDENIGYLSFGGMMAGDMEKQFGVWNSKTMHINDGIAGGPLVIFNTQGDTLVISSMSQFMVTSLQHKSLFGGSLNYGIMSGIDNIPKNFSADFIVYYSNNGINKAMEEWGAILIKFYNKDLSVRVNDYTNNYLTYWTDNGAYYYYNTDDGKLDYETTLLDVFDFFNVNKIPFRSFQYDSWWYGAEKGYRQGCFSWNGNVPSNRFPHTMEYVYNKTQLPVTAHNKFWDYTVKYAKQNGGDYDFVFDYFTLKSLPNEQRFWNDLFRNGTKWGLKTYEQDWLNHQILDFTPLMTNITLGRDWLMQMGNAARDNDMTVQYCMSLSRHVLQSLEINSVTQVRVTNDYATNWQYNGQQWRLGVSSIFANAVGLAPFKDVFWTSKEEPGNPYGRNAIENYIELNSVVSTLTAGPVGPGDKINFMNRTVIMKSCNDDGLLLKPSRPATSIDQQIYAKALGAKFGVEGEVWNTYSLISNLTFGVIFAADIQDVFQITPDNVLFDVHNSSYFWKYRNPTNVLKFNGFTQTDNLLLDFNCTLADFCLYYITPNIQIGGNSIGILGEQSKWIPLSPQRVDSIQISSKGLVINLKGALNETVEFSFYLNQNYTQVECQFNTKTQTTINIDLTKSQPTLSCL